jgi:hypothetical protein
MLMLPAGNDAPPPAERVGLTLLESRETVWETAAPPPPAEAEDFTDVIKRLAPTPPRL